MKTERSNNRVACAGFTLATTLMLLALAVIIVGSVLTLISNFARNSEKTFQWEKSAFLADTGLQAALVKLNAYGDAGITFAQSRAYFNSTSTLKAADWGFQTVMVTTNSQQVIYSVGRYNGHLARVQSAVSLGAGNRNIHAIYAHAVFAGNSSLDSSYVLEVGGTGTGADFVWGDTYSGNRIAVSGSATLRLPEILHDQNGDKLCGPTDTWDNAFAVNVYTNPLTAAAYAAYVASVSAYTNKFYKNGQYDYGEPFIDTIGGNGIYDLGETYTDSNGNGHWDAGDTYVDLNGNGVYNAGVDRVVDHGNGQYNTGEEWTEDSSRKISGKAVRVNGRWDKVGGYWNSAGTSWTSNSTTKAWPAEAFEDVGDGVYSAAEAFVDKGNGVYDAGETYLDDRNSVYDYGTEAFGSISGLPAAGPGQVANSGNNPRIDAPDLEHMYYGLNRTSTEPGDALVRWGNDVAVTASDYGTAKAITDVSKAEHIFVRNPLTSGNSTVNGKTIQGRAYTKVKNNVGTPVDDYFFEDPTDASYNNPVTADKIAALNDSGNRTAPMYVNVTSAQNGKLYYVDGNVYIHHPVAYSMRFRTPGTRITIVANGNITIADEFFYNASYATNLDYEKMNSTVVQNPQDVLCLIALKNASVTNSGNVYIGDQAYGTGGSIHAMLYAENNFIDNNVNSQDQQYISVFGNMTAGNQVKINRTVGVNLYRTRLDVTLDERIRLGTVIVPGLPHPVGGQRSIYLDTAWRRVPGTWVGWSGIQ